MSRSFVKIYSKENPKGKKYPKSKKTQRNKKPKDTPKDGKKFFGYTDGTHSKFDTSMSKNIR